MFARLALLITLINLSINQSISHFLDPSVAAFPIRITEKGQQSVRLANRQATCTFSFQTAPMSQKIEHPSDFDLQSFYQSIKQSDCVSMSAEWWDYDLCFKSKIIQRKNGDNFLLGKDPSIIDEAGKTVIDSNNAGVALKFVNGADCRSGDYNGPRETVVRFVCDPSIAATALPRLVSITEPQTCRYEMKVATSAVCGDSRFQSVSTGMTAEENAIEDWFLEINELHGDSDIGSHGVQQAQTNQHPVDVVCTVYSLEARAQQSHLNFNSFELRIDKSTEPSLAPSSAATRHIPHSEVVNAPLVVARHPGRRVIQSSELNVQFDENSHSCANTEFFNGQLAFVKLYA